MKMKSRIEFIAVFGAVLGMVFVTGFLGWALSVQASDHDDGEMDLKGRSLNLTDLYAFREDWQDSSGSTRHLILMMNTNPRSLPHQQYFFSPKAAYDFHVTRVEATRKNTKPTGKDDVVLRFQFETPDTSGRQKITFTTFKDNRTFSVPAGVTSTLADANANRLNVQTVSLQNDTFTVFAGLREDPFFFDVERYFRIRGLLATGVNNLGSGPIQGGANVFRSNATAVDFTAGYNVNSIVVRVPISFLQSAAGEPVFDIWETISIVQ